LVSVQLDLPFLRSPPPPEPFGPPVPADPTVHFVRMRRARRYILRVRPDGSVRVTVPRGGSRAEAVRFLEKQAAWVQRERARVRSVHVQPQWTEGSTLLFRGQPVVIHAAGTGPDRTVRYGGRSVPVPADAIDFRPHIEADLRALARDELGPRLSGLAASHGLTIAGMTIRNQKSRWGSCSRRGTIALNFRLVQMPPDVCDYILIHELMHLTQQNHSRSFWRLVESACPGFRAAERWLKTEGRSLF
jgi:predicted metal-dependent hydrolase